MAKTTGPLLSFGATGQVGKTVVFGKWKGVGYVRTHVNPANPQTAEQSLTRNAFGFMQSVYKFAPVLMTDVWDKYVQGKPMTARNAFTKASLAVLRPAANLNGIVLSGGALGGPPPTAVVGTPGAGQVSCAIAVPATVPVGWSLVGAIAAAIRDQNPHSGVLFNVTAGEDLVAPYVVVLTGLGVGLQQIRAWLKWTRPDGTTAYSPEVSTTATTT